MKKVGLIRTIFMIGVLTLIFFFGRGTPKKEIVIPTFIKLETPSSIGQGRPIPYHEVLVGYRNWYNYHLIVYNDLNDVLSKKEFDNLEEDKIKKETNADIVIKNGPRFWVLDEISGKSKSPIWTLQGHKYIVPAYLKLNVLDLLNRKPYNPMEVIRDTKYVYYKNSLLYKLISPSGEEYIMQAASQEIDTTLKLLDLEVLEKKLNLERGWKYELEKTSSEFILESNGKTKIVQDDLRNTYQLNR
ncbi:MAG: hypothetical protein AB8F94_02590 [Saprospiraceae bacterium]